MIFFIAVVTDGDNSKNICVCLVILQVAALSAADFSGSDQMTVKAIML